MAHYSGLIRHQTCRVFVNPQSISRHLYCSICNDVFDDPMRTICGHTFCYICIEQWAAIKVDCPNCKQKIGARKLEKDLIAALIVGDLQVKCFHQGCPWEGDESLRKKHQRQCQFKPLRAIQVVNPNVEVVEIYENSEVVIVDEESQMSNF